MKRTILTAMLLAELVWLDPLAAQSEYLTSGSNALSTTVAHSEAGGIGADGYGVGASIAG